MGTDTSYDPTTGIETYDVIAGGGSCTGDSKGTYLATILNGGGTSVGLGPGNGCPTSSASDFAFSMTLRLTSFGTGLERVMTVNLSAPGPILLPGVQPVLTSNPAASGRTGAGTFSYRIYRNCDPFGNNATQFEGNIPV